MYTKLVSPKKKPLHEGNKFLTQTFYKIGKIVIMKVFLTECVADGYAINRKQPKMEQVGIMYK